MELNQVQSFLGWCSVINLGILIFATIMLSVFKNFVSSIHSKILGMETPNLSGLYFNFLGNYKIAIFVFNIVPYFSLKLIA